VLIAQIADVQKKTAPKNIHFFYIFFRLFFFDFRFFFPKKWNFFCQKNEKKNATKLHVWDFFVCGGFFANCVIFAFWYLGAADFSRAPRSHFPGR